MKLQDLVKRLEALRLEPRLYIGEAPKYQKDWMSLFADVPEYVDVDGKKWPRQSLLCFGLHLNGKPRVDEASYAKQISGTHVAKILARYAAAVAESDAAWERIKDQVQSSAA